MLINETQALAGLFPSYSVSHVCRKGNSLAHNFVRHARHVSGLAVWMEDVLPHLNNVLITDYGRRFFLNKIDSLDSQKKNCWIVDTVSTTAQAILPIWLVPIFVYD